MRVRRDSTELTWAMPRVLFRVLPTRVLTDAGLTKHRRVASRDDTETADSDSAVSNQPKSKVPIASSALDRGTY
jgi:hypothetical protein